MKRILCFSLFLLLSVTIMAQTQQGVAYRYNGRNARTPLGNVTISYDANKRSTISAENGTFALTLTGKQMGDRIGQVTVKKREMMVFNQQAVDEWSIRKEPLMLILCNADEFEKQKENLIAIGRREAKKKYDKQKAELEAQLNASKIKEAEYEEALDKAYEELETLQKNMDKYVDAFVRIDLSEVSAEEQRILDMVNEGRIDEAVDAYEKLDISGKLRQARENKKALSEAKTKIEEEETRQAQVIEELIAKQEREIATLKLAGGKENYDKVGRMLKENALADTTDYNAAYRYATFAEFQNDIDEAERFYLICLNNYPKDSLFKLHSVIGDFYGSEMVLKKTVAISHFIAAMEMAHEQGNFEWEDIARINLGVLYYETYQFDKAEIYYKECLDYRTKRVEQEPSEDNISSLVSPQLNMGYLYASKGDSAKAEYYLYSALKNCEMLFERNPNQYRDKLANAQLTIARHYLSDCKFDFMDLFYLRVNDSIMEAKTDSFFCSALENYRILYHQKPDVYRGRLSNCLNQMGNFYKLIGNSEKAFALCKEAFDLENLRYKNNPRRYQKNIAVSYKNLGIISNEMKDTANAEKHYLAALNTYEEFCKENSYLYIDDMRSIYNILYGLYKKMEDSVNCEKYLILRIKLEDAKYENDPSDSYEAISSREDLGKFYIESGRLNEAKSVFEQIHQIDSTKNVKKSLADCYRDLGEASSKRKDFKKAKEYLYMAIDYYKSYQKDYYNLGKVNYLLGENYWIEKDTVNTEKYYLESLDYYTLFYQKNPNLFNTIAKRDCVSCQYQLGTLYKEKKDYIKAEKYFLIALDNYAQLFNKYKGYRNDLALTQGHLGDIYYMTNDYIKAEKFYYQALDNYIILFNNNPETYRSKIAYYEKYLIEIIKLEDIKLKNDPSYSYQAIQSRENLGRLYIKSDRLNEAKSFFEQVHQIDSTKNAKKNLADCYSDLGDASTDSKDYNKAKEYLHMAIDYYKSYQNETGDHYTYNYLGKVHYSIGKNYWIEKDTVNAEKNYLESLDYYTLFYQKEPNLNTSNKVNYLNKDDLAGCQYQLGTLYKEKKDYIKAEKYFLIALDNYTQFFNENKNYRNDLALTQSHLGDIYYRTNDYVKAEKYYLQALDNYNILFNKDPDTYRSKIAWIQYSLMYIYAKDDSRKEQYDVMLDAALTNYEAIFQKSNSNLSIVVDLRKRKGWRYLQIGKIDEAVSLFESSYKLSPEKAIRYLAIGYNAKAYEYAKTEDFAHAIETIDKAISLKQNDANLYDSKGEMLLMKGDEQGALEMWLKVMEVDPDFLSKHNGKTPLYEQLKERGLIK